MKENDGSRDARKLYHLGEKYRYGEGVERDCAEAAALFRRAAEQGYAPAQYDLGKYYECVNCVDEDEAEAVKWYKMAAEQGDICAKGSLNIR